jgi:hypothetical protein
MARNGVLLLAAFLLLASSPATSQPPRGKAPAVAFDDDELTINPLNAREWARAKFAAVRANPKELAKARLAAAQDCCRARVQEFLAGRGTLDLLLEAQQLLLHAELAVSTSDAQRVAAYERYWEATLTVEMMNKARFEAHRISIQDYAQTRYERLDAELQWLQARARLNRKEPIPLPKRARGRRYGNTGAGNNILAPAVMAPAELIPPR